MSHRKHAARAARQTSSRSRRLHAPERLERRQLMAAHVAGSSVSYATIQAAVNAAPPGASSRSTPGRTTRRSRSTSR